MRKRARRIPAFMNSGKGSLLTRLILSGDFSFWFRLSKNPRGFCLLLIPRERVSKWNNWRLQSVNSKGYKINLFVNFHFTTHIKYFNNLFSAKPMRRRPWESRSKFGMASTQSQLSIFKLNSQLSSSILNSQVRDQLKLDNRTEWSPCFGCLHQRPFDFPDLFLARPQIVSSFQNYTYPLLVWNLTLQIINQSRKDLDV